MYNKIVISFNELGRHGRLGNQMFQYAALKGLAAKHNYQWCIPPSSFKDPFQDHQLFNVFKLTSLKKIGYSSHPLILESDHYFDKTLFDNCPDNVDLGGFFQTKKYFIHIENEIKNDFKFKDKIINECKNIISNIGNSTSVHIRRTDFETRNECLEINYYLKGLEYFKDADKIIIFSDDVDWCKNQSIFNSNRFYISEFKDNAIDLCLMTLCSGHIIANSSFSWWGAWLADSKKIIAPKKWFGRNDTADIIPDNWIQI